MCIREHERIYKDNFNINEDKRDSEKLMFKTTTINNNLELNKLVDEKNFNQNKSILPLPNNSFKKIGKIIYFPNMKIGQSGSEDVYYGMSLDRKIELSVKKEKKIKINSGAASQAVALTLVSKEKGFPRFFEFDIDKRKDLEAETLLGLNLEKLFQFNGGPFDLYTIGGIGLEIIERLESLHKHNIVHNDIKPANLCWGKFHRSSIINKNTIYCIDLGLANILKNGS
mgnify:CR=1 FL=1